MPLLSGPFTRTDNSLHICSDRAEPCWYQGSLAINFHEHCFLHFKVIFVSLSALVFNYPAGIFPFHKQNTKHSATEMHQNYCLEKHIWCLASCFSQQKVADVSTALMHRSIWAPFHKRQVASLPGPILLKPNGFCLHCQCSHQCCHTRSSVIAFGKWINDNYTKCSCFYKLCWTDFSPFFLVQEWEDGKRLMHLWEFTWQLQKKCVY